MPELKVERSVELAAPAEVVWDAITDADRLSDWFGGRVALDPVPGGAGRFEDEDGEVRTARVDTVEPGRRLTFRWWGDADDSPITSVSFELVEVPEGTRVVVTETALLVPDGPKAQAGLMDRLDRRWAETLVRLEAWTAALTCV
jgi:uncharacterized protein YndB with AHSA1/START domain